MHYAMLFRMSSVELAQNDVQKNGPLGNPKDNIFFQYTYNVCLYIEGSFKPCSKETVYIYLTQYIPKSGIYSNG